MPPRNSQEQTNPVWIPVIVFSSIRLKWIERGRDRSLLILPHAMDSLAQTFYGLARLEELACVAYLLITRLGDLRKVEFVPFCRFQDHLLCMFCEIFSMPACQAIVHSLSRVLSSRSNTVSRVKSFISIVGPSACRIYVCYSDQSRSANRTNCHRWNELSPWDLMRNGYLHTK